LAKAPAGTFMYVESGEEALGEIAKAIAARLSLGAAQPWSAKEAIAAWGRNLAALSLGSNSRVRGKAAAEVGWSPTHRSVTKWIPKKWFSVRVTPGSSDYLTAPPVIPLMNRSRNRLYAIATGMLAIKAPAMISPQ